MPLAMVLAAEDLPKHQGTARSMGDSMRRLLSSLILLQVVSPAPAGAAEPLAFHLTFTDKLAKAPFTGRVFVMLSAAEIKELPQKPKWFNTEPFFARDVKDWRPGEPLVIDESSLSFPTPLSKIKAGGYSMQAIMDFDLGSAACTAAPGNGYSKPLRMEIDPAKTGPVKLVV